MTENTISEILNSKPEDYDGQPLIKALLLDRQGNGKKRMKLPKNKKMLLAI